MLATPSPDYVSPKRLRELSTEARKMAEVPYVIDGVLVEVDDVDAHFARAREAGATILSEPADQVRRHPALPGRGPGRAPLDVLAGHRMSRFRYVVADVFTDTPLQGNQVAVFTDAREIPEDRLQPIAREMNYSETVFVYKPEGDGHARIRIFTPTIEMPFAGHPTLGTAFILSAPLSLEEIKLETGAGLVPVRLEREDGRIVFGRMEQPLPTIEAFDGEDRLLDILGVERAELPGRALRQRRPARVRVPRLARTRSRRSSRTWHAWLWSRLRSASTASPARAAQWKNSMFAPAGGVAEDPATGSAAGPLALHLARHGRIAFGEQIEISQGVEIGRPSKLYARVDGSADEVERVEVGGSAVTVAHGELRI